jgi:hypothetical protein
MKSKLILSLLLSVAPLAAGAEQLVPAGAVLKCTVAEPKVSSKTMSVGDPVLCELSHTEAYSRFTFPFGSYLVGHFQDYKDPGHFVGKGWMELRFDRLVIEPDTNVPINARVVAVPKYPVDDQGRIHGTGHATRDTIEWLIPVLWPIDLINLPRRGPRPVLKAETQLTLKVLDDFGIPSQVEQDYQQPALIERREAAIERHKEDMVDQGYMTADQAFGPQDAAPVQRQYAQGYGPQPYAPMYQAAAAPAPQVIVIQAPQPMYMQPQPIVVQQPQPMFVPQPVYVPGPPIMYGYYGPRYYPPPPPY